MRLTNDPDAHRRVISSQHIACRGPQRRSGLHIQTRLQDRALAGTCTACVVAKLGISAASNIAQRSTGGCVRVLARRPRVPALVSKTMHIESVELRGWECEGIAFLRNFC